MSSKVAFSIHRARLEDLAGIAECLCELAPTDDLVAVTQAWYDRGSHYGQRFLTVVAVTDRKIIGTATLLIERKLLRNGSMAGHIEDVAVLPDYQYQGVGFALITHLKEEARRWDCYKVTLDCDGEKISFYEKCGFTVNGTCMRCQI